MILYLNTQDPKTAEISLIGPGKTVRKNLESQFDLSERFLKALKQALNSSRVDLADLAAIAVVVGPGLFSRLRTAVVAANTLAFALGIKVIPLTGREPLNYKSLLKRPKYAQVLPRYGKAPNITGPRLTPLEISRL
jgi:tRNA A37 threonylcarbamoyladenosine modification protein TsaB